MEPDRPSPLVATRWWRATGAHVDVHPHKVGVSCDVAIALHPNRAPDHGPLEPVPIARPDLWPLVWHPDATMIPRLVLLGASALAVLAVVVVIATSGDGRPSLSVLVAVCDVARAAREGDHDRARAVFFDDAHEPLHQLATTATGGGDRGAAARLLEAKNVVESAEPGPTPVAADDLVDATRAALAATGDPSPPPCP